jgi:hypothetical protein
MIQAMAGIQQEPHQQSINVRDGLGMLIVGIIENQKMLNILNNPKGKGDYGTPDTSGGLTSLQIYVFTKKP